MLLPDEWAVPDIFRHRLGERAGRQRAMDADGHLLLILHRLPNPGDAQREGILFWRQPDGTWQTTARGEGLPRLRRHVDDFSLAVDQLETHYESARDAADLFRVIQSIMPLHRAVSHMHAALQSAREAVPADRDLIVLRDRAGEVERTADLLHQDVVNALNFSIAQRSEELSRSSHELAQVGHRINMLAALFLPFTAIMAVFSMTTINSGLERFAPAAFWVIAAAGLLFAIVFRSNFLRRATASSSARKPPMPAPIKTKSAEQ